MFKFLQTVHLFNKGVYRLHSKKLSNFKIDCEALDDVSIKVIADIIRKNVDFKEVYGIPDGGMRLAEDLKKHCKSESRNYLIVDDVLTTGTSMHKAKTHLENMCGGKDHDIIGVVVFSRMRAYPTWIKPLFVKGDLEID